MKGTLESVFAVCENGSRMQGVENKKKWIKREYGEPKQTKNSSISSRLKTEYQKSQIPSLIHRKKLLKNGKFSNDQDNQIQNQSCYINRIVNKYELVDSSLSNIKEEMELIIDKKNSEIQALRVHRDELKFISCNNPYDKPIKISLGLLKQKAKTQQKVKTILSQLQKGIKLYQSEYNMMSAYYSFISNTLQKGSEENLIIDSHDEEILMIQNLEKETNYLFRELKQEDKRNAKEIRVMQDEIYQLRISIKQKEDKIKDLKANICCFHIKLHGKGCISKNKSMSLSNRKYMVDQNPTIQEFYIGNKANKHKGKQILQKISSNEELTDLVFYFDEKKQNLSFKCMFSNGSTKLHSLFLEQSYNQKDNNYQLVFKRDKQKREIQTQINIKQLLSIKVYIKSKIVGIQCRLKTPKGNQSIQIGTCQTNLQYELLTLINKRISTIGSYWYQKELIGIGLWHTNKLRPKSKASVDSRQSPKNGHSIHQKISRYSPSNVRSISKSQYYQYD